MRVIWLFITIFTFNDSIEFYVPIAQHGRGNKIKIQTTITTARNKAKQCKAKRGERAAAATHQIMTVVGIICKQSSTQVGDPRWHVHTVCPTPPPSPPLSYILHFNMPEVSRRQCGRHLSKSYRVLASRHAKLHSIKMTTFLLVNQKSFHVDEPHRMNSNVCVCVRVFDRVSTAKKRDERGKSTIFAGIFAGTAWTAFTKRIKVCYAKRFAQMKNENLFAKYCCLPFVIIPYKSTGQSGGVYALYNLIGIYIPFGYTLTYNYSYLMLIAHFLCFLISTGYILVKHIPCTIMCLTMHKREFCLRAV